MRDVPGALAGRIAIRDLGAVEDYTENWRKYKRTRNLFWLMFVGYVPVVFAVSLLLFKLLHNTSPGFAFALAWMAGWMVTGIRLNTWRCPRCGKWFAAKWWYNKGFFARKCVHCGLPKYTPHP
jgi:hypothetical protein